MKKEFHYQAFGLNICSDLPLPQMLSSHKVDEIDVCICEAQQPIQSIELNRRFLNHYFDGVTLYLHIPKVAIFRVTEGNRIEYSPKTGFVKEHLALQIMSTLMPHLLQQRGLFVLKAMAVAKANKAYLFGGSSPDGKSFLAATLMHKKGYRLLSDEICAIDGNGCVLPGYNRIKLWRDCLSFFKKDYTQLSMVRPGLEKYYFPANDLYSKVPVELAKVVFFSKWNFHRFEIEPKTGLNKFMPLKSIIASLPLLDESEMVHSQLQLSMQVAAKTPAIQFIRPTYGYNVQHLLDRLEKNVFHGGGNDTE